MASRAAVDFAKVSSQLGLGKNTLAQISAFRKRNEDARRALNQLKQQSTTVDFAHYDAVLKNKDVVNQAKKILNDFKPVTYDVQAQLKAIDAFEAKATEQAQATATKIEAELKDLKATLKNIEEARPFNQLTTDDVIAARPEIGKTVEEMVKKGKWTTPGYEEKFGSEYTIEELPVGSMTGTMARRPCRRLRAVRLPASSSARGCTASHRARDEANAMGDGSAPARLWLRRCAMLRRTDGGQLAIDRSTLELSPLLVARWRMRRRAVSAGRPTLIAQPRTVCVEENSR
ncbi:related to ATP7 - F1F0-ATPase complex, FO D subunit [Pseudozyma flocculosa]|uniref:ATP synthase subunit d, mitochondrial n=1 Tax=Pseudozyma flocculosa TaxID=84751 RepID=A0A5C3F786_9BASI|nr:related to ATP7 - F1F0-ATPase complex, FO D subunit [Pseudozyma flocculosa]